MAHPTARVYFNVFAALVALLAATLAIAEVDLGPWNFPTAAAIATGKALLIALFFMHLRYCPPLTWLFAGGGIFWLGILIGLTYSDYATRSMDASTRQDERSLEFGHSRTDKPTSAANVHASD